MPTRHFSTSDYNWPLAFPGDAIDVLLAFLGLDAFTEDTCALGSEIRLERQVLGERFGIVGTPFSLRYASDRQRGYLVGRTLRVQVTPDPIPSSMLEVHIELLIAGQRIRRRLPAEPGLIFEHTWDGEDAYGRTFRGPVPYELSVGYGYRGQYVTSSSAAAVGFPQLERAFGSGGERRIDRSRTREDVVTWRTVRRFLTIDDARREGLLGLTLDAHHRYEPTSGTLLRGDGGRVRAEALPLIIDTVAGGGSDETPGTSARSFRFRSPKGLAVGDDGQLYVATNDSRIWRVDRSGLVHLFAGNGTNTTSGDGGPAIDAGIANPEHLAWGPDGALYIGCVREAAGDECSRIRRVRADGVIETVAGNGTNARREGDGLAAVEAPLEEPRLIAFDPDGTLYFVDGTLYLRAVGTDGALRTLNPTRRSSDDRTPLSEADLGSITSLAVGRDSVLYVGSNRRGGTVYRVGPDRALYRIAGSNGAPTRADPTPPGALALEERLGVPTSMVVGSSGGVTVAIGIGAWIRRITPDGMLEDVAGRLSDWPGGDGGSAAAATLVGTGQLAQGPRGELFLTDINPANRVRRIAPSFGSGNADEWLVPSGDGTLRYVFSSSGRHLRTETATVGYPLLAFRYDPRGRLVAIDDADGNSLTISREADRLNPFAIRSVTLTPTEGPATTLHDDDRDGYADRITIAGDDDARATRLGWDERGLLTRHQDRFGITHVFGYDELGRLVTDGFEGYPSQTLEPFEEDERAGVTLTTAAGRTRSVAVAQAGYTLEQRFTDGVGLETAYGRDVEGRDTTTFPDGTTQSVTWRPDELLGAAVAVPQEVTLTTPGGRSVVRTVEQTSSRDPATGNVASRLTTLTHAAGTPDESTITQVSRVEASGASTTTVTTGVGRSGTAVQNERGELVTLRRPGRHPITLEYDDRGRLERASQGPEGRPELQRQITYALPSLPSTTFGDVTATDATGRAAVSRADTLGRPSAFADAAGAVSFDYEDAMRTETVTPPGRSAHRFVYDDRGRLERYEPPMLASGATPTTYGYDDDGVLERVTYPDGRVVESIVDGAGRFTSSTVTMGPASDRAQSLVASYDTRGVLDELTWTHDAATSVVIDPTFDGPLLTNLAMRGAVSANVAATFDDAFRLDTMTLAAGGTSSEVGYSYDDDGLHDGVLVDGERFALRLAPASGDRELLTTRGLQTEYRIDAFGGLEREVSTWSGQQLGWTQTFDLGGRVQTRTEVGASAQTWTYDYDDAGRLDSVTRGGDATPRYRYEYDANGNRIGWSSPTSSCTSGGDANRCVELDAQDRLRRYGPVGGADTVTLDYDSRGRLLVRRDASGTTRYDYDPYGNLRSVQLPSRAVRYLADPLGRRIAREVDGARTHAWVYGEGLAPLGQLDAAGRLEVTFIYLTRDWVPDLALHRDGTLYRVISDPIGSVRAVVDLTTGAVVQRYEYSPFGEIERAEETRNVVPFRFAGGLHDELTGLTRFGARDYDARLGRWTAKDPIGFAGGDSNLYGYVANDPVNYFDPSGLVAETAADGAAVIGSCFVAPIRDALAGCGNGSAHASRCAMSLAAFIIPGVSAGMLHGGLAMLKGLGGLKSGVMAAAVPRAARGLRGARRRGSEAARLGHAERAPLPTLDGTGKVHGPLPRASDLPAYSREDLEILRDQLKVSTQTRIEVTTDLGRDRPHGQRQGAEQDLLRVIERILGGD